MGIFLLSSLITVALLIIGYFIGATLFDDWEKDFGTIILNMLSGFLLLILIILILGIINISVYHLLN
jgi:fucose permease